MPMYSNAAGYGDSLYDVGGRTFASRSHNVEEGDVVEADYHIFWHRSVFHYSFRLHF